MKVILLAAISVDGFIAQSKMQSSGEWNSAEDKRFFRERSTQAGTLIMGSTTFATINRGLPNRKIIVLTSKPENFAQFNPDEVRATNQKPAQLIKELAEQGLSEVAICGGGTIYHQFLAAGLVDELILTMEPVLFGSGIKLLSEELELQLKLLSSQKLNQQGTTVVNYSVQK